MKTKIDVIIPVYRGLEETSECIISALATLDMNLANLIVINDCSPEPALTEYLRNLSAEGKIQLLENDVNLGFVATVNRGMKLNTNHDVLLLNSDVEVANDWLERIQAVAYQAENIGSVTPFSNNATICSFPNFCEDNTLFADLSVVEIDNLFSQTLNNTDFVDVPTGVGFCMYIRRDCLDKVGYFDEETFGKGYGEENDWCQRAIKSGWRNVHALNVFAYHKGGVSFADEQDPRKEKALEILNELHPNYQPDVMDFIAQDPAKRARLAVTMKLLALSSTANILAVSHGLGGGVLDHIHQLASFTRGKANYVLLQPTSGSDVKLSFFISGALLQDNIFIDVDLDYASLIKLLQYLNISRVHFHHTMGLPTRIWGIASDLGIKHDVTIHDYYHINGNPSLTDINGRYCGDKDNMDELCHQHYPIPVSSEIWRENAKVLLAPAERIIFPSFDVQQRFNNYFSLPQGRVVYHSDNEANLFIDDIKPVPRKDSKLKVLVLGALSREKGAEVLEQAAMALANRPIEFHLLGYAFKPLKSVTTYGQYNSEKLDELIRELQPDVIWFPALWPETYSYTLSAALRSHAVIIASDLGAFKERLAKRSSSIILPWDYSEQQWSNFWEAYLEGSYTPDSEVMQFSNLSSPNFYSQEYLSFPLRERDSIIDMSFDINIFIENQKIPEITKEAKILHRLARLKASKKLAWLARRIPLSVQRKVKERILKKTKS
ncbi:glycosyltransferase [Motilimonas sp. E26]|uniref:glycosyltransferase n=1 Tax=Motilimonas sp. E26 TaxID=2865674 RepID=UPI001E5F8D4E|nr:glycosyltransferase [Motilimonas sp. E26]MCE0558547.1 glycosyltransferase [Motilimonas sp. E26]